MSDGDCGRCNKMLQRACSRLRCWRAKRYLLALVIVLMCFLMLRLYWMRDDRPMRMLGQHTCGSDLWIERYQQLHQYWRNKLLNECEATWASGTGPHILVHRCEPEAPGHHSCMGNGLGDRLETVAGLFQLAVVTNRAFFIDLPHPRLEEWFDAANNEARFDWSLNDARLRRCIDYGLQHYPSLIRTGYLDENVWGWGGNWAKVRLGLWPRSLGEVQRFFPQSALVFHMDAMVARPRIMRAEFSADFREAEKRGQVPIWYRNDDVRGTLLSSCFLSKLLSTPSSQLTQVSQPFLENRSDARQCLIGVHIRYGDRHMAQNIQVWDWIDDRVQDTPESMDAIVRCAVKEVNHCRVGPPQLMEVVFYISSDLATTATSFQSAFSRFVASPDYLSFPSNVKVSIRHATLGSLDHSVSFDSMSEAKRQLAEAQLLTDFYVISQADSIVLTGSQLSRMAAARAGRLPVVCRP